MRPVIRKEEFEKRQKKVQKWMGEKGLDLVILYADDRFVYGQAYARWLLDYQPEFEPAFVLIPAAGTAAVVTGAESVEFVYQSSCCEKAYAVWEFLHPDEEYPYCEVVTFRQVREELEKKMGKPVTKAGLAGTSAIPYHLMKALQEIFGAENLLDADSELSMLRAVKTENELEVIRYAYEIAQAGMKRAAEVLRPGVTEREVAAEAEYIMRKMGSEGMGIETMVASGPENTAPILSRTTCREIQEGDLVVITLAPRYEGYHGAVARPFYMGKAPEEMLDRFALLKQSQEHTERLLREGEEAKKVDEASRKLINDAGMGVHFTYTGVHSTGVIEFEAPILASKSDVKIEENMVFSIDIPMFLNDWGGMRLENGYIIKKDKAEPLVHLDVPFEIL